MPHVEIMLMEGRNADQIAALHANVAEAVATSVDVDPDRVKVVIREVPKTHWSSAGVSRAASEAASA